MEPASSAELASSRCTTPHTAIRSMGPREKRSPALPLGSTASPASVRSPHSGSASATRLSPFQGPTTVVAHEPASRRRQHRSDHANRRGSACRQRVQRRQLVGLHQGDSAMPSLSGSASPEQAIIVSTGRPTPGRGGCCASPSFTGPLQSSGIRRSRKEDRGPTGRASVPP